MGISFFHVTDCNVLVSTLVIWGICCIPARVDGQELILIYLLTVPVFVVLSRIKGYPEVNLTAMICICLLIIGVARNIYSPLTDIIKDASLTQIIAQTDSLQGLLLTDSKFINGSKQEFQIKVDKITDTNRELSSSAKFEVKVIIYNPNRFFSGEWVDIPGQFVFFESIPLSADSGVGVGGSKKRTLVFYASDISLIQSGSSVVSNTMELRKRCIEYVYHKFSELPHEVSELSTALLLGRKEDSANPIIQLFREAGCAHILALSGMHLQVLSGLILCVLRLVMGPKKSKIVTWLFVIVFVWITGGKPSLIRSMIMFLLISNRRKKDLINPDFLLTSLAYTLALQSLIFPATCSGPGYFLSYSAILGIVVFSGRISIFLPGFLPNTLRSAVSASLAAFTVSSPFLVHYFGEIYPIGIIASIPLTVLVTLYMISSMILLMPIPSTEIFLILRKILTFEYRVIESISRFFGKTPAIIVERNTVINAFIPAAAFVLLTVFVSIEYSIYKNRGKLSAPYITK
ncbi:MAG: ComEC/Rec2 family competence protein [Bacteroidetes bacterium]|nr:ComEC/Rec2 family competence protein [Bacteroidota bacterium]